jgi:EAL domain-containing protein (putative c-di-GMP-specific phosphodiesterase class I)
VGMRRNILEQSKSLGVQIAIDDFGTAIHRKPHCANVV